MRDKKVPASVTYDLVGELRASLAVRACHPQLFVNDRVDIAIAADLDGVHLAAKSLPVDTVHALRKRLDLTFAVGCSVHASDEAVAAERAGADYVTFGHVFPSASHPGLPPQGLRALERVVEAVSIPVIAIGGIDERNVREVLATGCSGIAVIGAVLAADRPRDAASRLKDAMASANVNPKVPFSTATTRKGNRG
ncbi:thiamine-phosphate synthase [Alicyclobacillus sacchari]|uniref:thiamine phosphate synthase n=1 Tax=Alicyclobacillus sacchari TaxID=392010 RepID=UPI0023E91843|nr:thiamine phosphate synthase [Alicyclobacillus sacchari]GMA56755.1 thiamine-phosphate synthase [Alicyclobacillus sacchari]